MDDKGKINPAQIISEGLRTARPSDLREGMREALIGLAGTRGYHALLVAFWLGIYAFSFIALDAIRVGYHEAYATTREIPWGILISTYIFFVVTSTGLCIVSSIGHVFGVESFQPIAKRAVFLSIVTIMCGFAVILLEIENPFRMILYNMITPNLRSNIWWMGTLYGAYMMFMIFEYGFMLLNWHKWATLAGFSGLITGVAAHSNLGAIFGMLHGREFWYGPYMPIYFIASAAMSGCAAIVLFTWLAYKFNHKQMEPAMLRSMVSLSKVTAIMISVVMFFTTWKIITGYAGGAGKVMTLNSFIFGPYAINFWVFEVALGMVIPFILMLASRGKNLGMMASAAAMMVVGIFFMRYDLVVLGQVVSVFYELGVNEYKDLLNYTPSFHEFAIVAGSMFLLGVTFILGEKVFKGHPAEEHHGEGH